MSSDTTPTDESTTDAHIDEAAPENGESRWRRRPLLQAVGAAGATSLSVSLTSRVGRAEHETDPCSATIDFNRAHVARVFDVAAAGLTSLTVFYFDRDGDAQKQEDIDPTTNADYGPAPLRVRYDGTDDKTTIQIGGRDAAIRRVVAFGPECRSAKTNPLDEAVGDNEAPTADFTWTPDPVIVGETATFTSTATDPDGELIHYGWDVDDDGTEDATGEEVSHTFATGGNYDVTHTVVDDFDASDSETTTVSVVPSIINEPDGTHTVQVPIRSDSFLVGQQFESITIEYFDGPDPRNVELEDVSYLGDQETNAGADEIEHPGPFGGEDSFLLRVDDSTPVTIDAGDTLRAVYSDVENASSGEALIVLNGTISAEDTTFFVDTIQ